VTQFKYCFFVGIILENVKKLHIQKYHFLHIVMKVASKIVVKLAPFYTKNHSESNTFLHHLIPSPWR
jgi:hypothetical protein